MLSGIRIVTVSVARLTDSERAYRECLGFRTLAENTVSERLAAAWDTPRAAGSPYVVMQNPGGSDVYLRLIERPPTPGYSTLKTHGWNANEILVSEPEELEARLRGPDSPFKVIGAAAPLDSNPNIVAMQATGPDGELVYFTRIPSEGGTFIKTPARAFVDRTFIVVAGGPRIEAMRAFYATTLKQPASEFFLSCVTVLNQALGRPIAHRIPMALVPISPSFVIELDEYPAETLPRPRREGDLPPGIAMVSFVATRGLEEGLPWRAAPRPQTEHPYFGQTAGVVVGAAGEWIELIFD